MLCMNSYPQDYIDECQTRVNAQLAAYKNVVATAQATHEKPLETAIASFEPVFFNNLVLVLDQLFVHRSRALELKDGNPLNEVRLICESLLNNNSKMIASKGIKLDPNKSILNYKAGDEIKLSEADFMRLSGAFFSEIVSKFGEPLAVPQ